MRDAADGTLKDPGPQNSKDQPGADHTSHPSRGMRDAAKPPPKLHANTAHNATSGTIEPNHGKLIIEVLTRLLDRSGPRPEVAGGLSQCFGLSFKQTGQSHTTFIQPATYKKEGILQELNHLITQVEGLGCNTYTALQCNWMTQSRRHQDKYNEGTATIMGLGEFCGGAFRIEPRPFQIDCYPLQNRWATLDLTKPHWNDEYTGERATIIMFNTTGHQEMTVPQREDLTRAGFQLPPVSNSGEHTINCNPTATHAAPETYLTELREKAQTTNAMKHSGIGTPLLS